VVTKQRIKIVEKPFFGMEAASFCPAGFGGQKICGTSENPSGLLRFAHKTPKKSAFGRFFTLQTA
jgi:hypothetical protein